MKRQRLVKILLPAFILLTCVGFADEPPDVQVPIPGGRDIREIRSPADLGAADYKALLSDDEGMRYYYERFSEKRAEKDLSITVFKVYFVSLIDLDYSGVLGFATKILSSESGLKSVDSVMAALPNLMAFFESLSDGEIEKTITDIRADNGTYQDVSLHFKLSEKEVRKRYPGLASKINNHIKRFEMKMVDADGDILIEFKYENNLADIHFLLDPRGYFIAYDKNGKAVGGEQKKLGIEEARRGLKVYIDAGFDSSATLIKIFKIFRVEVKRIRVEINARLRENLLAISWEVKDVEPGIVDVTGLNPQAILDNLFHMEGTLKGMIDLRPAASPSGEKVTFLRVFGTGEEIDNWLVNLALLTWEQVGGEALADLSAPIADALLAAQRDVMLNTSPE